MDPIRAGRQRPAAQGDVIVLADRQHRPAGGMRLGDREDPVVCPCGEVDDHVVDGRQGGGQRGHRPERDDLGRPRHARDRRGGSPR